MFVAYDLGEMRSCFFPTETRGFEKFTYFFSYVYSGACLLPSFLWSLFLEDSVAERKYKQL